MTRTDAPLREHDPHRSRRDPRSAYPPADAGELDRPHRHVRPHTPVFMDRTGRRRRVLLTAGIGGTVVLAGAAIGLLLALTGTSGQALPGLPAVTARAHATTSASPGTSSVSAGTKPAAGGTSGTTAPAITTAPSPTPQPVTAPTGAPSSTVNPHRHVPTQTPSHSKK